MVSRVTELIIGENPVVQVDEVTGTPPALFVEGGIDDGPDS